MIPFAAVLLAGGQSRRMGRDKVLLPLPDGRLLWQRQLEVLEELGPAELFVSGPPRPGFPPEVRCLPDETPGQGPLGGVHAAFTTMKSTYLVVLAIDLPRITAGFLQGLLELTGNDATTGVVPRWADDGFYEPLAAVYPSVCQGLAERQLAAGNGSMQHFVRAAGTTLKSRIIQTDEAALFVNWNQPQDVASHG